MSGSGTAWSSASVSPTANALIVVAVNFTSGGVGGLTAVGSDFATGGWTIVQQSPTANDSRTALMWAIATADPGTGSVNFTFAGNSFSGGVHVIQVASDFDTTTPIGATINLSFTTDNPTTGTFSATPASDSLLIGASAAVQAAGASPFDHTPESGWTDLGISVGVPARKQECFYAAGSNGSSFGVTYPDAVNLSSLNAVEIVAAAGGGATLSLPTSASITQTTATIGCTSDSDTGTLYAVVTTSATPPSAAQVEAGQDHAGSAAVFAANDATVTIGTNTFAATGLTADTAYYTYFVQDVGTAEYSNVLSGSFTTAAVNVGFRISSIQAPDGSPIGNVDPVSVAIWNNAAAAHGAAADTVNAAGAIVSSVLELAHAGTLTNEVLVDIQYSSGDPLVLSSVRGVTTLIDLDA